MSRWYSISSGYLRYWEERCVAVISETEAEIAGRKSPTAGQSACLEIQGRQLVAIRRELHRRGQ